MIIENKNDKKFLFGANSSDSHAKECVVNTHEVLLGICQAIREGGYNPVSQIVGYIISEDPTHITNYKNARTLMSKIDRYDLLEEMVKQYIDYIEKDIKDENA